MEAITAVCRECKKRFPLGRRANQHRRANGSLNKTRRFCSSACKQAAYRRRSRNADRPKMVPGTNAHAAVTRPLEHIETVGKIRTEKTTEPRRDRARQLDRRIGPDAVYPGMYRIRLSDGSLSDMVNSTRAKDAVRDYSQGQN
jgi:hypothetical protein